MRICSLAIKVLHIFVACLIVGSSLGWFPASVNASSRTQAPDFSIDSSLTQNTAIESSPIVSNPLYSPANGTWEVTDTIHLSGTERPLQMAISGGKAYISRNPGHLTVLDLSTNTVVTTISFDPYPGATPHYIGILGDKAYVALGNLGSDGQLAVINIANNTVAGYIPVGAGPYGIATLDQKVYVTNNVWWSSGDPATVKVVDANTNSVVATIPVGINPTGIALDPVSRKAYVTNRNDLSKSVSVIDTNANSVIATIPINNPPAGVAISGNRAYVTTVVNMPNGTVEVIDISTDSIVSSIPVGRDSWGIAASNDYVFVANQSSSTVSVIEVATNSVVATVNVGDDPTHVAVDPSTNKVYVSNQGDNTISIIEFIVTPPPSNQQPTVSITTPSNNVDVSGIINVQGTASDPDGSTQLQKVEVKTDAGSWVQASGTTSWSYSWDTATTPNGQHSIYARSYDGQAYSDEESIAVNVNNMAPTPSLVDVGISSEAEAWPPKTFLQAEPGDRINTWYRISYAGSLIRVKLKTTIFDPNGSEIDNPLNDPILQINGPTEDTGWIGVTFKIPDEAIPGTYDVRFSVWSEDGAQEYDTVTKLGWLSIGAQEGPDIGSVGSIDFGNVSVGDSLDGNTTIYNEGNATLTVNSVSWTSGSSDFTYVGPGTPFEVGAGGSKTVTVRFAPNSEGSKSATFNISSNDPDEASVTFNVAGSGVLQKGTINVNSNPSGASFTLSGPASYSGITPWSKTDAPAGTYTITWTPISGYQTPLQQSKTLTQGGAISFHGEYQLSTGTIQVTSEPSGADFTLSGPANYSGITPWSKTGAPAGSYTITWGSITGYTTPSSETKTLTRGGTISFSGPYQTTLVSGKDVPQTSPSFFNDVLNILSIPRSGFTIEALTTWTHYENTNAYWNPLATTRDMGVKSWNFNNAGVKNYADQETGVRATTETLILSYYEFVRKMLAQESFDEQALRRAVGTWSGLSADTPYVVNLVTEWKKIYPFAAKTVINVTSEPTSASFTLSGPENYRGTTPWRTADAPTGTYTVTWGFMSGYETPLHESKTLTQERTVSFHGIYPAIEAFPGANAATLWDYYSAWGKQLPPLSERAKMYEALGLGSAENYAGTAEQNTRLLNALKDRQICPSTGEEVGWVAAPPADTTELGESIDHRLQQQIIYPPYLLDPDSFTSAVSTLWNQFTSWITQTELTEKYDELYWSGIDYDALRLNALIKARNCLKEGDAVGAQKYLQKSNTYGKLSDMSFQAANDIFIGNLEAGEMLAEGIKEGCEASVKLGLAIVNPTAGKVVDYLYIGTDYAIDRLIGEEDATKNALVKIMVTTIFNEVKFKEFGNRTLADYTNNRVGKVTFPLLQDAFRSEQVQFVLSRIIKHSAVELEESVAEKITALILNELGKAIDVEKIEVKSPVELRVYDSQQQVTGLVSGEVKHHLPRSVYDNGIVTVFFPTGSYRYEVVGVDEGTYALEINSIKEGETNSLTLTDIPTSAKVVHEYSVDWSALAKGEKGVTVKIDSDGDGTFEAIENRGREETGFPWIWIAVAGLCGLLGVLVGAIIVRRRMGGKQTT